MQQMKGILENKSWIKKPLDRDLLKGTASRYGISLLKAAILLRRGIHTPQEMLYFLESSPVFLHNPFLFTEMIPAIERILNAIEEEENIMIFGDSDADGICSTALFLHYFQNHQIPVSFSVPLKDDHYGLSVEKIKDFQQQGITLIICVDNGSSADEAITAAYQAGIDVLVFDHHTVDTRPQHAFTFINPQYEDQYPNKGLSASALVLKAIFALDFAQTEQFSRGICLLHVQKTELGLLVQTTVIVNLIAGQKQIFHLQENSADNERFLDMIQGFPLYTFHAAPQKELLADFFSADVYIHDLAENLPPSMSRLQGASLEDLQSNSTITRFLPKMTPLDVLVYLYQLSIIYSKELLPNFWQSFDLATIGLITDMMPMVDENRIIAKIGLKSLYNPNKTALVTLFNYLNLLGQSIDTKTIGWRIGPLINASGRMGQADKAVELLVCPDYNQQERLVQQLASLNDERKNLTEIWFNKSYAMAQQTYENSNKNFVLVYHEDLPPGLTGLLAGRFNKIFSGCLIVVAGKRTEDQMSGSLRTDLENTTLNFMRRNEHLFSNYGGHNYAGGFSADLDKLQAIEQALISFFEEKTTIKSLKEESLSLDAELPAENFPQEIFEIVEQLAPYGEGFKPLTFFTKDMSIQKIQLIGKNEQHLKLILTTGIHLYQAIWWNQAEMAEKLHPGDKIDLWYQIENQRNSSEKIFQILDVRVATCIS